MSGGAGASGAPVPVVAAVAVRDGRVLLCQRHDASHLPLRWEFPGGKVDPGESPREALVRELHEELGVDADVGPQLAETRHDYPDKSVWLRFYEVELDGEPVARVHRRIRWVPIDEIDAYEVPAANLPVVELLGERRFH